LKYQDRTKQSQASYWKYRTYDTQFLPQFKIIGTCRIILIQLQRITNDEGQDNFRKIKINPELDGTLSIDQRFSITGGNLALNSPNPKRIDRLDC